MIEDNDITPAFSRICSWGNLLAAWRKAAKGKRGLMPAAAFEHQLADRLLELRLALISGRYRPGGYVNFVIHEPKRRTISAAPFRDRVVHHALCDIIEPRFDPRFISGSFANRLGKGTHAAIDRCQAFARRYRYVLRADIVKHFASIDHDILLDILGERIPEADVMQLIRRIVASGKGILEHEYQMAWFAGDDLLAICRHRGLPIGNLTSQFWSNCYLHPFDQFVTRQLGCPAYLRYVDDLALFGDDKVQIWAWKQAIIERLARYRLVIHTDAAQVSPTSSGIPWLGLVVFPDYRRVKGRKVRNARRALAERLAAYHAGRISFAALDASIRGWINHVRYADSWGLRESVLSDVVIVRAQHISSQRAKKSRGRCRGHQ